MTFPEKETVYSGLDTLSHAMEGHWAEVSTPVTDAFALQAARIALNNLETPVCHPEDVAARK